MSAHNPQNQLVVQDNVTILEPYDADRYDGSHLRQMLRWPTRVGLFLIILFVMGFGTWASTVPLAGGAIANGIISPDGSKRTVQHLEGGIIRKLHVRDGDTVDRGQPLLLLESVQPQASHNVLVKQQLALRATEARLDAERNNAEKITFPPELLKTDAEMITLVAGQRELFLARRASHQAKNRILQQRIGQLSEQIKGLNAQVSSASRQIELILEEIDAKRFLAKRGYLPKPALLRMQRMEAEIGGRRGQYLASIAQAEQQIGEAKLQLVANDAERADKIAAKLEQVRAELAGLEEKLLASQDVLARTVITAPVSGTIVNLKFKTESGVIQPGTPILDIVPTDEKLLIDAHVSPMDIDIVNIGLKAQVQLTALSVRRTPRVDGVVRSVSADRLIDETTGQPYYLARVEVNRADVKNADPNAELVPGMPADVLIITGQRTMFKYLFEPLFETIWKSFREV